MMRPEQLQDFNCYSTRIGWGCFKQKLSASHKQRESSGFFLEDLVALLHGCCAPFPPGSYYVSNAAFHRSKPQDGT